MSQKLVKIILLGIAILTLLGVGVYLLLNPPQRTFETLYHGDPKAVTRLLMRDGTTGEAVTTEDPDAIAAFFELANSVTYTRDWDLRPRAGWLYYVDLFEGSSDAPDLRVTFLGSSAEIGSARYNLNRDLSAELAAFYHREVRGEEAWSPDTLATAERLFREYLTGYQRATVEDRLEDFTINTIEIVEKRENGFVFTVSYDVKPAAANSDWIAGNGAVGPDGWIVGKFNFVTVEDVDGGPVITGQGTGP